MPHPTLLIEYQNRARMGSLAYRIHNPATVIAAREAGFGDGDREERSDA
jgi:hypothetical protein